MMEFLVEDGTDIQEISELITKVSFKDQLNDGASKLEFEYIDNELVLANGSRVRFRYNDANIFYGRVFSHGTAKDKVQKVTAYDQLRYLKAKDTIVIKNINVGGLVKKGCDYFKLKWGNVENPKYMLPASVQDDKTWLDIIYDSVSETLLGTGRKYVLRDEYGAISLRSMDGLKLPLVLGDESLCYNYEYEKSIDDDTYNQVKIVKDNEKKGTRDVYMAKDSSTISKFGLLQYFEVADKDTNDAQMKSKTDALLKLYNREFETLSLDCLGDVRVRAGNGFLGNIEDIKLNKYLIVQSVTHEFMPTHTMSLEVSL